MEKKTLHKKFQEEYIDLEEAGKIHASHGKWGQRTSLCSKFHWTSDGWLSIHGSMPSFAEQPWAGNYHGWAEVILHLHCGCLEFLWLLRKFQTAKPRKLRISFSICIVVVKNFPGFKANSKLQNQNHQKTLFEMQFISARSLSCSRSNVQSLTLQFPITIDNNTQHRTEGKLVHTELYILMSRCYSPTNEADR